MDAGPPERGHWLSADHELLLGAACLLKVLPQPLRACYREVVWQCGVCGGCGNVEPSWSHGGKGLVTGITGRPCQNRVLVTPTGGGCRHTRRPLPADLGQGTKSPQRCTCPTHPAPAGGVLASLPSGRGHLGKKWAPETPLESLGWGRAPPSPTGAPLQRPWHLRFAHPFQREITAARPAALPGPASCSGGPERLAGGARALCGCPSPTRPSMPRGWGRRFLLATSPGSEPAPACCKTPGSLHLGVGRGQTVPALRAPHL